ncbi:hypothetical protein [Vibrio sp. Evd11]|nr:hypothetical protein [Vibrio sp. Evd11]
MEYASDKTIYIVVASLLFSCYLLDEYLDRRYKRRIEKKQHGK